MDSATFHIAGHRLPVIIQRRTNAKRMSLRLQTLRRAITLTLPKRTPVEEGLRFASSKRDWLAEQIHSLPDPIPLAADSIIPVLGKRYKIVSGAGERGTVRLSGKRLYVYGDEEFHARRLRDWLKAELLIEIRRMANRKAEKLGVKIKRISLRETSSRWGSCNSKGHLSFSWRLVFAPKEVLDYLVAHEVAHLVEMNHSPCFWATVGKVCRSWQKHRDWLRDNREELYRYKL